MKILFFTDVHLVGKSNINRKDNLVETQIDKLKELVEESKSTDLALSCGDIFHKYDPSISTMKTFSNFIEELECPLVLCPGNHDLHGYNYNSIHNTGLGYICSFFKDKVHLMNEDMEVYEFTPKNKDMTLSIHFKRTIDKDPMVDFKVDKNSTYNIGIIHDMVFNQNFFGTATEYKNFDTNLDDLFNGHIHHGHNPLLLNGTWFINPGSVSRMHKPNPYFDARYVVLSLGKYAVNSFKEIEVTQKIFKTSREDVFNTHEKKEFSNFINKIESQKIETNAIEYMFNFANEKLSSNALQLLKNIYEKVV